MRTTPPSIPVIKKAECGAVVTACRDPGRALTEARHTASITGELVGAILTMGPQEMAEHVG